MGKGQRSEVRCQMSGRARDRDPHPRGIAFGFDRAGITPVRFSEPTPVKYATLSFGIERGTAGQALINADLISHRRTQTHTDICPADPSTIFRSYGERWGTSIALLVSLVWNGGRGMGDVVS